MKNLNTQITWSGTTPTTVQLNAQGWVEASWSVAAGETFAATCRLALPETAKPFWCIPGVFWGDNQQDTTGQYYPRFRAGLATPRRFESSSWEFHVWRATQPLVAMHDGSAWWILEVRPQAGELCASVGFEYENGRPVLQASLPRLLRFRAPFGQPMAGCLPSVGSSPLPRRNRTAVGGWRQVLSFHSHAGPDLLDKNWTKKRPFRTFPDVSKHSKKRKTQTGEPDLIPLP
ncbi:MAG: hypothetical protein NTV93_12325 [Verrucomicrobia bacterium]|nr:hypothetical protein [Verrucomicrobiota bacterium]